VISLPDGVEAKIRWADHHLKLIDKEVIRYKDSRPHFATADFDPDLPGYHLYLRTKPPPIKLALIVGDFFQNLRNSLDHLARGLVETSGGTPIDYPKRPATQFPISYKPLNPVISGLDPRFSEFAEVERRVRGLQPQNATDFTPLVLIREYSNADKHRTLQFPTAAGAIGAPYIIFPPNAHFRISGTHYTDEEITPYGVAFEFPDPKVAIHGEFTTTVFMPIHGQKTGPPTTELVSGLADLLKWVRTDALPLFIQYFAP